MIKGLDNALYTTLACVFKGTTQGLTYSLGNISSYYLGKIMETQFAHDFDVQPVQRYETL